MAQGAGGEGEMARGMGQGEQVYAHLTRPPSRVAPGVGAEGEGRRAVERDHGSIRLEQDRSRLACSLTLLETLSDAHR